MTRTNAAKPTKAQRAKADTLTRFNNLSYEFQKRCPDGAAMYVGRSEVQVVMIVAIGKSGSVVRAASRVMPDHDPPFHLSYKEHGMMLDADPMWGDFAKALDWVRNG